MLQYNKKNKSFVLTTNDEKKAREAGLTLSTSARGVNGEKVFYTADHDKNPVFNPYAVLDYWDEADGSAKNQLAGLKRDYEASWRTEHDIVIPKAAQQTFEYLPYQKAGIAYGADKGSILIGDEPGLGKTIQAIGICNLNEGKKNLAIVPASIRLNWQREVRNWSSIDGLHTDPILKSGRGINPFAQWVIISYELARHEGLHAALCESTWDNLIVDEAHFLKSLDAQRTQAVFGGGRGLYSQQFISKKVGQVISLTGTPLPNRPRECFTLARALCPESIDWMSYDQFCFRFNPSKMGEERIGRLPELNARLRSNFMIRRLKKDVLKDLPDKRYELSYIEPDGKIRDIIRRERLLNFDIKDLKKPFEELFGMIATIRREMGEAKAPRVVEHMKYLLEVEEIPKIVLFAHHKSVMDYLAEALSKFGVVQVRGGVSAMRKNEAVNMFMHDPFTQIFLGQLEAAGFGIDGLQSVASHVVFAEPAWTPGTNEQAVDRCHRIGQHENVLAQFLVAEGSLDERILAAVFEKTQITHKTLDARAAA